MLKLIIADDEPLITKGIKVLVDWEQLGIQIVGDYQDGKSALYGIMTLKPEIAILDISMPGMTGIDILKEIKAAGINTKVIFLSGFQEFDYAREAIRYGVTDYLLKPVKKENLMDAIWKCIHFYQHNISKQSAENPLFIEEKQEMPTEVYEQLIDVEHTTYIPVAVDILGFHKKAAMEQKLIRFSVFGYLEDYLKDNSYGIVFYKRERICIILKGIKRDKAYQCLHEIQALIKKASKNQLGFVIGACVTEMRMIPDAFDECVRKLPYFYFYNQLPTLILGTEGEVFLRKYDTQNLAENRGSIINQLYLRNKTQLEIELTRFEKAVCNLADGDREIAIYHYLNCIRVLEENFEKIGIRESYKDGEDLIEQVRGANDYSELVSLFNNMVDEYYKSIFLVAKSNDTSDIKKAKNYIEEHYKDNISLSILADYIHMNPIYFSSYFKKQTGDNFKDYLNQVRMKHAIELLITTNRKSNEIAEEVGFRDSRYFIELFQRSYGKTPAVYRKDLSKN